MRKWWLESVRDAPSDEARLRLARSNAHTAVPIETVEAIPAGGADGEPWSLDERFLEEAHHTQYGRPWILGRYMFDFLVESGLRPEHRLCDFGCGALRLGGGVDDHVHLGDELADELLVPDVAVHE